MRGIPACQEPPLELEHKSVYHIFGVGGRDLGTNVELLQEWQEESVEEQFPGDEHGAVDVCFAVVAVGDEVTGPSQKGVCGNWLDASLKVKQGISGFVRLADGCTARVLKRVRLEKNVFGWKRRCDRVDCYYQCTLTTDVCQDAPIDDLSGAVPW